MYHVWMYVCMYVCIDVYACMHVMMGCGVCGGGVCVRVFFMDILIIISYYISPIDHISNCTFTIFAYVMCRVLSASHAK